MSNQKMSRNALKIKTTDNAKKITEDMSESILKKSILKDLSENIISEAYQSNRIGSYNNRSYTGLSKQIILDLRRLLEIGKISTNPNQYTLDVIFYLLEQIINKFDESIKLPRDPQFLSIYFTNLISIIIYVTININNYNKLRREYTNDLLNIFINLKKTSIGRYILYNALSITIGENDLILQELGISNTQLLNKKNYAKKQFNENYSSDNATISRFQYKKNRSGQYFAYLDGSRLSSGQIDRIKDSYGKSIKPVIDKHLENLKQKNKNVCTASWKEYNGKSILRKLVSSKPTCHKNLGQ